MHQRTLSRINAIVSTEQHFCEGYFANSQSGYMLGVNLTAATTPKRFSHPGSDTLDRINAFDLAEIQRAHLGQINMMQVSSFCGPKGALWGYDLCKVPRQPSPLNISAANLSTPNQSTPHQSTSDLDSNELPAIWDIAPLVDAFARLTGSVTAPRFPFVPGSHVPCAVKSITAAGPEHLYAAQAIAIPEDRNRNACLIMEDAGSLAYASQQIEAKQNVLNNLLRSVLTIGKNQQVRYREIFMGLADVEVGDNEMGCAMVANPYFLLAQGALPEAGVSLAELSLKQWETQYQANATQRPKQP
ncbi:histidine decarboxylase, pyruvoyl type [Porticoccaceae bacterium]|nr:histidine decarboxylase, pyruvoyl type [Porticoccaceae bacterium]